MNLIEAFKQIKSYDARGGIKNFIIYRHISHKENRESLMVKVGVKDGNIHIDELSKILLDDLYCTDWEYWDEELEQ